MVGAMLTPGALLGLVSGPSRANPPRALAADLNLVDVSAIYVPSNVLDDGFVVAGRLILRQVDVEIHLDRWELLLAPLGRGRRPSSGVGGVSSCFPISGGAEVCYSESALKVCT